MAAADVIVASLKDLASNKALDKYDANLCADIEARLEAKFREKNLSVKERTIFARNNFSVMNKWEQVFPAGISECLREYFRVRAVWSPKFDPRFPNQNQAKNCFVNFVDYQRCIKYKGADYKDCDYFKQASDAICPNQWLERFNEQIEKDAFPVDI